MVSSCQLSMRILTCWWWIWELVAYRLISNWGKSKNFQAGFLEKLQSKWVADHNLSNHLERKRFGAFCQLVCTKCHQCAKANAATNVAPFGVKNASKGWVYSTIFKLTYFNRFYSTFVTKTNFQNVSNSIFQLIFYCAAFFVKWHHISCISLFFKHFHFYFLCYHNILSIGNKIINICHNGLKMYPRVSTKYISKTFNYNGWCFQQIFTYLSEFNHVSSNFYG